MATMMTKTLTVTIDAPFGRVAADLADPMTHPEWGQTFFSGPARASGRPGEVIVPVPMMGGDVRYRIDGDTNALDLATGLRYALGDLSVDLTVEYDLLDLPRSKEDGFGVWLTVRRDFPSLFTKR